MKRKVGAAAGVAAIVIALVVWWAWGGSTKQRATEVAAGRPVTSANAQDGVRARVRPDPKTVSRGSFAGTVTDQAKQPIANARVCADGRSHDIDDDLLRDSICATSDAQGRYKIENLLPATYEISAAAKTFRPGVHHPKGDRRRSDVRLAIGEHKTAIDIALRPGGVELTGVVSDLTGGPIAHAQVWASGGRGRDVGATVSTQTDADGKFSLWVSPGSVDVTAAADGYADDSEWIRAPGSVELLLTPESTLSGKVVDAASGEPVAGARVSVGWDETTFSDEQGAFRVTRLTPGRHEVTARTDRGYGRTEGSTLVGLGEHVDGVIVKLHPAHRIEGTVMIASTKAPCESPRVSLEDEDNDRWLSTFSEPDGRVWAEGALPGTYSVQVWCRGSRGAGHSTPSTASTGRGCRRCPTDARPRRRRGGHGGRVATARAP